VGEAEEQIRRTLVLVRPVARRRKGLATKEEHLLLLARVLAESQRLHQVLRTRNVVKLAGAIAVANTAEERIAPAGRQGKANTAGTRRNGELQRKNNLRKALIRVERDRRAGAAVERLEALEETVVLHRRVALLEGVLLARIVSINTLSRADALLYVEGDLRLHLIMWPKVLFQSADSLKSLPLT